MADVTETLRPFDNSLKWTFINVTLREERDEDGDLLPAADRLYFEKPEQWERSDGKELKHPNKTLRIDDSIDTFNAGDAAKLRALLLKMHDARENVE